MEGSNTQASHGLFRVVPAVSAVQAAADAATAGRWFFINPLGSGRQVLFREAEVQCQIIDGTTTDTVPRVAIQRFTFTGTATGAEVTSATLEHDATPVAKLLTASTGLTLTAGGILWAFLLDSTVQFGGGAARTVTIPPPEFHHFHPATHVHLDPGQGLMCRQPDAGTASDPRRFLMVLEWSETGA